VSGDDPAAGGAGEGRGDRNRRHCTDPWPDRPAVHDRVKSACAMMKDAFPDRRDAVAGGFSGQERPAAGPATP